MTAVLFHDNIFVYERSMGEGMSRYPLIDASQATRLRSSSLSYPFLPEVLTYSPRTKIENRTGKQADVLGMGTWLSLVPRRTSCING